MEVIIVTGMSGAGKSKAADWFEDRGYYCIDNMPPALIQNFMDLVLTGAKNIERAVFVVDIRGGQFFDDLMDSVNALKNDPNIDLKILFFEAGDEALIRRYKEARRTHPLSAAPISKSIIQRERDSLATLRKNADYVIDTGKLKVAQLNETLAKLFESGKEKSSFGVNIISFGYKTGIPIEADWVVDVRFIPNPFYVDTLKTLTGNNKKVVRYVMKHAIAKEYVEKFHKMIAELIPAYIKEGKYSLTIAVGCTGGQHRSVAIANEFRDRFLADGYRVTLEHRNVK